MPSLIEDPALDRRGISHPTDDTISAIESVPAVVQQINLTSLGNEQRKMKSLALPGPTSKPSRSRMALIPLRTTPFSNVAPRHIIVRLPPANAYTEKEKCVVYGGISHRSRNSSMESGNIQEEQVSHRIDQLGQTVPEELP